MNTAARIQRKVVCSHYGGKECGECPFNEVRKGEVGKRFFCANAMDDMSGDIVCLVQM